MPSHHYIAIIDFGSQFAHLIARRIREQGVLAKIFTPDTPTTDYADAQGIILSGGPKSTIGGDAIDYNADLFTLGLPILGVCYGHQVIATHFGGTVEKGATKEYGKSYFQALDTSDLLAGLDDQEQVWMSHWDSVIQAPAGFEIIGSTQDSQIAALGNSQKKIWSLQFHIEVAHTLKGTQILKNFLFSICHIQPDWQIATIEDEIIHNIQATVPADKKVFLLISGGVDSTVAFALLEKALGPDRVYGLHIDNGFMRLQESVKVETALRAAGFTNLHVVDAADRFLAAVAEVADPETKRKIIGELFVDIANEEMIKLNLDMYLLGQGTIYPDTIESGGTKHADTIKTHHNRVDAIQKLIDQGKIVEPLKDLYKDEVRAIGKRLGLAMHLLDRHPFPGPGLAIRTLCSDGDSTIEDQERTNEQVQQVIDRICEQQNLNISLQGQVLPMKSVGVQGDERSYKHPVVLTGQATWEALHAVSVAITNQVFSVNRVLWLLHPQELNEKVTMRQRYLTKDRLDLLRLIDDQVTQHIEHHALTSDIWQFPIVLVPFGNQDSNGESIVLRPIQSQEAMTVNFYPMPLPALKDIVTSIQAHSEIDFIFYDITDKPPATIEWE